ncbi:MAG: GNAT family N-acetyltransferase [Saprospiraceae bacterium]
MTQPKFTLREILAADAAPVAEIIRIVMTEFGAVGEGYSINDPEMDDMYAAYSPDDSTFYVLEKDGEIVGCGGIAPLAGGDGSVCELRKMYFLTTARGFGQGRKMVEKCLQQARALGFQKCYLETLKSMESANRLYQKLGFKPLCGNMGHTGHSGCDAYYALDL